MQASLVRRRLDGLRQALPRSGAIPSLPGVTVSDAAIRVANEDRFWVTAGAATTESRCDSLRRASMQSRSCIKRRVSSAKWTRLRLGIPKDASRTHAKWRRRRPCRAQRKMSRSRFERHARRKKRKSWGTRLSQHRRRCVSATRRCCIDLVAAKKEEERVWCSRKIWRHPVALADRSLGVWAGLTGSGGAGGAVTHGCISTAALPLSFRTFSHPSPG